MQVNREWTRMNTNENPERNAGATESPGGGLIAAFALPSLHSEFASIRVHSRFAA